MELESELAEVLRSKIFLDRSAYMIGGEVVVDELIPYERLWDRLAELGRKFGHELPEELPMAKSEHRKDRRPASEILSAATKSRIQAIADFEFDYLNFER